MNLGDVVVEKVVGRLDYFITQLASKAKEKYQYIIIKKKKDI